MSAGFGKAIVSAHMLAEKRDYVKSRADYIGWSQSMMFERIVDYWLGKGAPSLHGRDKVTPVPKFKEKQELDQRRYRYAKKTTP
jgi:hypothetical protein